MVKQQLLYDCDGRQQVPGLYIGGEKEIIPSGKGFVFISEAEENQTIYRQIEENCNVRFLKEQSVKGLDFYPVPLVWLFAYDTCGNYFGTLNGIGGLENVEYPVVFINKIKGSYGKIAENMKEFFSLVNFHPYWRKIIECEQQNIPYDLKKIEREYVAEEQYLLNQKEISETLSLSRDPDAIKSLINRVHSDYGFFVYASKEDAEKDNEFIAI